MKANRFDRVRGFSGSVVMACFGAIAFGRLHETGLWFFALFGFRDFVASYYLWNRSDAVREDGLFQKALAYTSSALPLFYFGANIEASNLAIHVSELLSVAGFVLVTLATLELGERIGVGAAARGARVETGIYRFIGHPMYVGYVIAELGLVIVNSSNSVLFAISALLYLSRARSESRLFSSIRF